MVIGAGVIGLACAFRLARLGQRVLLMDRSEPGHGASFGNAGHIATEQVFPLASPEVVRGALGYLFNPGSPLRIRPAYLLPILPWLARFAWAARPSAFARGTAALSALQHHAATDIATLLRDANAAHLLTMNGHLLVIESAASLLTAKQEMAHLAEYGVETHWLSSAEVAKLAPDLSAPIEGAWKFTGTGHVADPLAVCDALRDAFFASGGKFLRKEVVSVESAPGVFTAQTVAGTRHRANNVVLCCGAWSKDLARQLGYRVPLDTERGYHITVPNAAPRFDIPIASFERKIIMTPMSCGLRMTGTVEFGGLKLSPDDTRFDLLTHHMRAMLPNVSTDGATQWMGFRPSLPDHLPVLGRVPDGRNIFFAFGHQHLGLTLAGVTARIIADQVMLRDSGIELSPFAADRFH